MFWVIFIMIWICSLAIHIAMAYYTNKRVIFTIGDLIDEIDSFMWFPLINTLIVISVAFIAVGTAPRLKQDAKQAFFQGLCLRVGKATLLKLDVLWKKFRNINLK